MKLFSKLLAIAALLAPAATLSQAAPAYKPGVSITDTNPPPVKNMCWSGSAWAPCSTSGGGGDASAANQTSQIALARPYDTPTAMTVGTTYTAARGWQATCTAAGNVALTLSSGSITIPVNVGLTLLPYAVTQVATSGTTAVCSYANLN